MILARYVSTVLTVIPSCAAISLFIFPCARRRMISISRGVGRAPALSLSWCSSVLRNPSSMISDTFGVKKRWPSAMAFTAFARYSVRSDFKRYVRAPASNARRTIWSDSHGEDENFGIRNCRQDSTGCLESIHLRTALKWSNALTGRLKRRSSKALLTTD